MIQVVHDNFAYEGLGGCISCCRVRMFFDGPVAPNQVCLVLTELPENRGSSITNVMEELVAEVLYEYRRQLMPLFRTRSLAWMDCFRVVEHYTDRRKATLDRMDEVFYNEALMESFRWVKFDEWGFHRGTERFSFYGPQWGPLARETVERWTGKMWRPE